MKSLKQNIIDFKQNIIDRIPSDLSLGIEFKPNHLILTLLRKSFRKMTLVDCEILPTSLRGSEGRAGSTDSQPD